MKILLPLALAATLILTGCGSDDPVRPTAAAIAGAKVRPAPPGAPAATVIFYRPGSFKGKFVSPTVFLNGEEVVEMANDSYFRTRLSPGTYKLKIQEEAAGSDVSFSAGRTYYFLLADGTVRPVSLETGKFETGQLEGSVKPEDIVGPAFR